MRLLFASAMLMSLLALSPSIANATEHLILFGGGDMPTSGKAKFIEWAGGSQARILVIPWSSGYTREESLASYKEEFLPAGAASVDVAPAKDDVGANMVPLLTSLDQYTAIFFTGGVQTRTTEVLASFPALRAKFHSLYHQGIVFAGTSAGTAIMSKTMLTGDGDVTLIGPGIFPTQEGLGLLDHVIVDQHFIIRQRLNRLVSVLMEHTETTAIGVDEGTALAIESGCHGTVLGPKQVIVLRKNGPNTINLEVVTPGSTAQFCN